jgi:GT2 family glycosyltransferase
MGSVAVVVVTYNGAEYLERCLESARGYETVVVDHGSSDDSVVIARRLGAAVVEQENLGLAAGWNAGIRRTAGDYVFILNADAWVVGDGLERLSRFLDEHPRAAVAGPRLRNTDGSLQRSVRGFPTPWRLATEYFFLRKLAPGSQAMNAFYAGGFAHDRVVEAESLMGAAMLVRRAAIDDVGPVDEGFFLFSEETDWHYRFRRAGWTVLFTPEAEVVHVGGAGHGGRMFDEQLRGHVRFMLKHHGAGQAELVRRELIVALWLRGLVFPGERGRMYADGARFLASGSARALAER